MPGYRREKETDFPKVVRVRLKISEKQRLPAAALFEHFCLVALVKTRPSHYDLNDTADVIARR